MKYAILIYETPQDFQERNNKDGEYWGAWYAYTQYLGDHVVQGSALHDTDTATTIRLRQGERFVEDGPFADTKERLGGFMVIEAKDLDEAMELAVKCPSASTGSVEVRPILEM